MGARLIDGKAIAAGLRKDLAGKVRELAANGVIPGLGVVLVGNDAASKLYVGNKEKACAEIGIQSFHYDLPDTVTEKEILALVEKLNKDRNVDGILVQLPLPEGVDG